MAVPKVGDKKHYPVRTAQPKKVGKEVGIDIGINYPWSEKMYGWDFGKSPPGWNKPDWKKKIKDNIKELKDIGIFAVRWFILADGLTYGTDNYRPKVTNKTDKKGNNQWRFDPPSLTNKIKDDFRFVLNCIGTNKMKFVPSLIDFQWCWPGEDILQNSNTTGFVKKGRADIIVDPKKSIKFCDNVLKPLLEICKEKEDWKKTIYAWEIINEPEGATYGLSSEPGIVEVRDMQNFIDYCAGIINSAGFKSTVGYRKFKTLRDWNKEPKRENQIKKINQISDKHISQNLGITLHQFHHYPIPGEIGYELPKNTFDKDFPCFIGEFATTEDEYPDSPDYINHWPELKKESDYCHKNDQSVYCRLKLIEKKKYPCAFLWSMNADHTKHSDWNKTSKTKDSIRKYIKEHKKNAK